MKNDIVNAYLELSKMPKEDILKKYKSRETGLKDYEVSNLLQKNGKNRAIKEEKKSWLYFFLMAFKDTFIIILLFLAIINYFLGDKFGSIIIVCIALISALIRFFQEYSVYKFNNKLKSKIYSTGRL